MALITDLIKNGVHPCLHCGSLLKSQYLLCELCMERVTSYLPPELVSVRFLTFDVFAAFHWNPGASDLLSAELVALKGGKFHRDWSYWAQEFMRRRSRKPFVERPILVVPAPSSNSGKDHAHQWAEALAQQVGGEVVPCLRKGQAQHQRGASLSQRLRVQIELDENSSRVAESWSEALWIFADDIVTTGSTALAAYEALGSPPHFEVWALARRSLSCGASRDLL